METATHFPITHSIVDAAAVRNLVHKSYDLGADLHCQLMSRGANDQYMLRSGDAKYAIRVLRHEGRSLDEVNYEMALINFFKAAGFGAAAPVADKAGGYYHELAAPEGMRYLTVFEWAEGVHLWGRTDLGLYERLGAMTAKMHEVCGDFDVPVRVQRKSQDYMKMRVPDMLQMLRHAPDDAAFYESLVYKTADAMDAIDPTLMRFGAVHADIHPHNVFVGENDKFTLIDWDNCGDDFLAKEITSFTWRMIYGAADPAINEAFMRGYEEVRRLDEAEKAHMALFMMSRHLFVLCGIASMINVVGNSFVGFQHDLDRYRSLVEASAKDAGML